MRPIRLFAQAFRSCSSNRSSSVDMYLVSVSLTRSDPISLSRRTTTRPGPSALKSQHGIITKISIGSCIFLLGGISTLTWTRVLFHMIRWGAGGRGPRWLFSFWFFLFSFVVVYLSADRPRPQPLPSFSSFLHPFVEEQINKQKILLLIWRKRAKMGTPFKNVYIICGTKTKNLRKILKVLYPTHLKKDYIIIENACFLG